MAKKQTLEQIETSLARWKTRLRRAMTAVDKLEKQKKRIQVKTSAQRMIDKAGARPARGSSGETAAEKPSPVSAPVPAAPAALATRAETDTDIPAFLRHQSSDPIAEQIRQEQAETKKAKARGRIEKMKAKRSGETRKMPLSGKAALAAIRG
jgi:hypothetical protein